MPEPLDVALADAYAALRRVEPASPTVRIDFVRQLLDDIRDAAKAHSGWLTEDEAIERTGLKKRHWLRRFGSLLDLGLARVVTGKRQYSSCLMPALPPRRGHPSPPDCEEDTSPSFVYCIRNTRTREVKIGVSGNPEARLASLRGAIGAPLELLAVVPGDYGLERELHERFQASRLGGEWFQQSDDITKWITGNQQGEEHQA